ncbi:P-loop containing nucleoside triphosphate hydrolase protein, partial [Mycena pura]
YSITAQFDEGDPAYQWILFLTQENVWRRSSQFVNATNSRRKWSVKTWADPKVKGNAEYLPTYQQPQLFRWRGRWLEIKRSNESGEARFTSARTFQQLSSILVTMYTLDMGLLSELVEDARQRYIEVNRPNVVIHLADAPNFGPTLWSSVKQKVRRPLKCVYPYYLPPMSLTRCTVGDVVDALVHDAQEFIASEDWYVEAGIPHRRGYLLHGLPGTGKTSTIYALAGALNVEIYSLSLASSFVDDAFLARAASSIPKNSIFLIEDIDCTFPSRDDEDELADFAAPVQGGARIPTPPGFPVQAGRRAVRSLVTLSGLLNVIDGVGSMLFFATVSLLAPENYIDRLDPALLRPGRIDHKVQYELTTEEQARALFARFFPEA